MEPDSRSTVRSWDVIGRRLREVAARTGPWTAHNIEVAPGVFTRGPELGGDEKRVRNLIQLVADLTERPFESLRVLDLGALEGGVGIEFALHGAEVVFVEGREQSAEKIRFAIDALAIESASVRTEDVRALSRAVHGEFDVVLCLGLLYHLDQAGVFALLRQMEEVCRRVLLVDAHVAYENGELCRDLREEFAVDPALLSPIHDIEVDGRTYRGRDFPEHPPGAPAVERLTSMWASLDNEDSLWLTGPSLINAFLAAGFTSVFQPVGPYLRRPPDRHLFVGITGEPMGLRSTSLLGDKGYEPVPESQPQRDAVLDSRDPSAPAEALRTTADPTGELDRLRAELAQTRVWLDSIQSSASWRLTAPLRAIKQALDRRRRGAA